MSEVLTLTPPDSAVLLKGARDQMAVVESIVIADDGMLSIANDELGAIKKKVKFLEEQQKSILSPLAEAEKRIRDLFRQPLTLLKEAEGKLKIGMGAYMDEQERKRRQAQREAEEAARKERERLEQEAARAAAEATAEAQRLAREAETAKAAGDSAKAAELAVQAQQTADQGAVVEAQTLAVASVVTAAPVQAAAKIEGTSMRRPWKGRVSDKGKLVAFIAANPAYLHLLDVNESQVNALAKAMQERLTDAVPGLEAYQEIQLAKRA